MYMYCTCILWYEYLLNMLSWVVMWILMAITPPLSLLPHPYLPTCTNSSTSGLRGCPLVSSGMRWTSWWRSILQTRTTDIWRLRSQRLPFTSWWRMGLRNRREKPLLPCSLRISVRGTFTCILVCGSSLASVLSAQQINMSIDYIYIIIHVHVYYLYMCIIDECVFKSHER